MILCNCNGSRNSFLFELHKICGGLIDRVWVEYQPNHRSRRRTVGERDVTDSVFVNACHAFRHGGDAKPGGDQIDSR